MNTDDACDYIIVRLSEGGIFLNVLKLHKLLYYCQAWSLAFGRGRLFSSHFQAWVHGPVSREIYDRFVQSKALYSPVSAADIRADFNPLALPEQERALINSVLEVYAPLTGDQLEEMTHREDPWIEARSAAICAFRKRDQRRNDENVLWLKVGQGRLDQ